MVVYFYILSIIPELGRLRQDCHGFEDSLGYIVPTSLGFSVRHYFKTTKIKQELSERIHTKILNMCSTLVEYMFSIYKILGSVPITAKQY